MPACNRESRSRTLFAVGNVSLRCNGLSERHEHETLVSRPRPLHRVARGPACCARRLSAPPARAAMSTASWSQDQCSRCGRRASSSSITHRSSMATCVRGTSAAQLSILPADSPPSAVPEPGGVALLALEIAAMLARRAHPRGALHAYCRTGPTSRQALAAGAPDRGSAAARRLSQEPRRHRQQARQDLLGTPGARRTLRPARRIAPPVRSGLKVPIPANPPFRSHTRKTTRSDRAR